MRAIPRNAECASSLRTLIRRNIQVRIAASCGDTTRSLQQSIHFPRNTFKLLAPRVYVTPSTDSVVLTSYKTASSFGNPHATSSKCNSRSRIRLAEFSQPTRATRRTHEEYKQRILSSSVSLSPSVINRYSARKCTYLARNALTISIKMELRDKALGADKQCDQILCPDDNA